MYTAGDLQDAYVWKNWSFQVRFDDFFKFFIKNVFFDCFSGLFYEKHLKYIKLNEKFVPFSKMNMSYLTREVYDKQFINAVYQSAVVSYQELREGKIAHDGPVRIVYYTKESFKRTAKMLGLMDDFRVNFFVIYKLL